MAKLGTVLYWIVVGIAVLGNLLLAFSGVAWQRYAAFSRLIGLGVVGPYVLALILVYCAVLTLALTRLPREARLLAPMVLVGSNNLDTAFASPARHLTGVDHLTIVAMRLGIGLPMIGLFTAAWVILLRQRVRGPNAE